MGSFCGKRFFCDIPSLEMGSLCVFLYSHNRIGGDCQAGMGISCRAEPLLVLPSFIGGTTKRVPPYIDGSHWMLL